MVLNFEVIDTEDKAYILGLFAADGYVRSDLKGIAIGLSGEDKDHVRIIRDLLQSECKVSYYPKKTDKSKFGTGHDIVYMKDERCVIQLHSPLLVKQFVSHNVTSRKSHTISPPDRLSSNLIQHYIRGFFDGDGTVCLNEGRPDVAIYSASRTMMNFINEEFRLVYHHKVRGSNNRKLWSLHYSYRTAKAFLDWIYHDAVIYLPRKYNKYLEIVTHYGDSEKTMVEWSVADTELLSELYATNTNKDIALKLNRSTESIRKKAERLGLSKDYSWRGSNFPEELRWSVEELDILYKFYPYALKKIIRQKLPRRTWAAINAKATELKIHRRRNIGRGKYEITISKVW